MPNPKLKYISYTIAMQEVPDEISLVINISGCPYRCKNCHSQYLRTYTGNYLSDDIDALISAYDGLFTCVCFMGGDQNIKELYDIGVHCKSLGYKTCLYSGSNNMVLIKETPFDYIKLGEYREELGGLNSPITNQKMFKITNGSIENITYRFQR